MNNFDTLFPNFLNQCTEMNHVLTPIAFVLLAIGIVSSTVTGRRSPSAYLRTIGRTFAFAAVLAYLPTWSNEIATTVDSTVRDTLHADPAGVYQQYQKALVINKGSGSTSGSKSWWDVLDGQALFEAVISAIMWMLGFIASVIVFYAYLVQKFILYVGYALAPIFIGFLAVRTLHSIGVGFLLGYAGVLAWPIGWGAASLLTAGLINFMTDQSFLSLGGVGGSAGYGLQNLLGLAALQHDRRTDYHAESNRDWRTSWTGAGVDSVHRWISWCGCGSRSCHDDCRWWRRSCCRCGSRRRRRSGNARRCRSFDDRQYVLAIGKSCQLVRRRYVAPTTPPQKERSNGR